MDWVRLEFLCEASRTVERFGLLGGKLRFSSHHILVNIFNLRTLMLDKTVICIFLYKNQELCLEYRVLFVPDADEKNFTSQKTLNYVSCKLFT